MRILGIVLAAGAGQRMGGPKALLELPDGSTFLARTAALLSRPGVQGVVAVTVQGAVGVARAAAAAGVPAVLNPRPDDGMLGSIRLGLDEAERSGADAVLLLPVDHPLVAPATVDAVVGALRAGARIAVPSFAERRGHPGGFARSAWDALRAASPDRGARGVLADHPEWVVHVPGDPGSVTGMDTPADYERAFSRPPCFFSAT